MRRVLPGGATLGVSSHDGDERPVVCRPGAFVLERTRLRGPADSMRVGAVNTTAAKLMPDQIASKLQETIKSDLAWVTRPKPPTSWLRDNFEKIVIPIIVAVLSAIILGWLGLNK